jgi:poly-gamma-glutamate capsule biosynthesis protein CapA/YwtB (metallophosphatase superfamily)
MILSRRALLPLLAAIPFRRPSPPEIIPQPPKPQKTRILLGGDVMLSRHVARLARAAHDPSSPLRDLAPVLRSADIAFVNLEAPFSDRGRPMEHGMVFKAEPEMIAALQTAGVTIVSTANNHARDCGSYGVEFTLSWLQQHGILAVGSAPTAEAAHAGNVVQLGAERNGLRFGFLAYTFDQSNGNHKDLDDRIAVMDIPTMQVDIARLLEHRADVVIVSMHAGTEYQSRPNPRQIGFAHAAIDAGASVVAGHHPHVTQPWARRGKGVIFYSLGNLVFDQFQRVETQRGALAEVVFSGKTLESAALLPVDIVRTVPRLSAESGRSFAAREASSASR